MLGALSSLTGGGGMSASGGDATSGNGDQDFNSNTSFGGLNYGDTGIDPTVLVIGVVIVALFFLVKK
jgi:hypothetical protein